MGYFLARPVHDQFLYITNLHQKLNLQSLTSSIKKINLKNNVRTKHNLHLASGMNTKPFCRYKGVAAAIIEVARVAVFSLRMYLKVNHRMLCNLQTKTTYHRLAYQRRCHYRTLDARRQAYINVRSKTGITKKLE